MSERKKMAEICQSGASNRRRVSRALHEAIEECNVEGVSTEDDPFVFLILHQLVFLLTGDDIAVGNERLSKRWDEANKEMA